MKYCKYQIFVVPLYRTKEIRYMITNSNIAEALNIMNSHDWYWMMSEEYTRCYNAAKASMRHFVKVVNAIDNAAIRESLKALWMLRYNNARNAINGQNEDNTAKEQELMSTLALAA